jgi:predicted transcriptional regulator
MTPTVITMHRDKSVSEVQGLFVDQKIGGAPLVDDEGKLTGFVSKSDVNRFDFTGGDPYSTKAWEIAHPKVITIEVRYWASCCLIEASVVSGSFTDPL